MTTIERQLSKVWSEIHEGEGTAGPVRTSILNLVVFTAAQEVADTICSNLDRLAGWHPSRTIILIADRLSPQSTLDAAVSVRGAAGGTDIRLCHERLIVTAYGRAADHLSSVVSPLLLPELPTYLWWPGQPLFGHRQFHRLLAVADQLVVDSAQFGSPGDGLADVARLRCGRQGVNDFHWARLAPWREIVAQFFDGPSWLPYAHGIESVTLTFASGGNATAATAGLLLMLGWVAFQLGWEPETTMDDLATRDLTLTVLQGERLIPIDLRFADVGAELAGRPMRIKVVSKPQGCQPARFSVERSQDGEHAEVTMEVQGETPISRVVPLHIRSDVELLADELSLGGHDRLYDDVVEMASRMAGREVWVPV